MNIYGFAFDNKKLAQLARKEEEGVRYIKEHTALDNPDVVLSLYSKLINQNLFTTPVGIRFLIELQTFLYSVPGISYEEILPIPTTALVETIVEDAKPEEELSKPQQVVRTIDKKVEKKTGGNYKTAFHVALFFAIILALSVVGMFAIAKISGNNVNILNYRNEIINEYVEWENELKAKEEELREWEAELEEKEETRKE